MVKVAWRSTGQRPHTAWTILTKGVCDGCALGVAGFHDWTHRRRPPVHHPAAAARGQLRRRRSTTPCSPTSRALRDLPGDRAARARSPRPTRCAAAGASRGSTGSSWDEALDAHRRRASRTAGGDRTAIYLTSRGITNEVVLRRPARRPGRWASPTSTRPPACATRRRRSASSRRSAWPPRTCSLQDVLETDLIVLWGTNSANNQPVFTKYLYLARKRGARVVVVNPYLEPGLERYWVPSNVESALFGTKLCDLHVPVRPGGDVALANAVLQAADRARRRRPRRSSPPTPRAGTSWSPHLDARSTSTSCWPTPASTRDQLERVRRPVRRGADAAVLRLDDGHHPAPPRRRRRAGASSTSGLARGNVGRDGAGLMPIRGHSGVQGGAEMGAYATALPGRRRRSTPSTPRRWREQWGFDGADRRRAHRAGDARGRRARRARRAVVVDGGNFLDVLPDPPRVEAALGRVPLRVHQDIVLTSQMLVDGRRRDPAAGGDPLRAGGRRHRDHDRAPDRLQPADRRARSARPAASGASSPSWRTRVRPDLADRFAWADNQALRAEIAERRARSTPASSTWPSTGDAVQWGGRHLCAGGVVPDARRPGPVLRRRRRAAAELPDGRVHVSPPAAASSSTRWCSPTTDPLTGAGRDAVYIDARRRRPRSGVADGDRGDAAQRRRRDATGTAKLVRLPAAVAAGALAGGQRAARRRARRTASRAAAVPDYNAVVTVSVGPPAWHRRVPVTVTSGTSS